MLFLSAAIVLFGRPVYAWGASAASIKQDKQNVLYSKYMVIAWNGMIAVFAIWYIVGLLLLLARRFGEPPASKTPVSRSSSGTTIAIEGSTPYSPKQPMEYHTSGFLEKLHYFQLVCKHKILAYEIIPYFPSVGVLFLILLLTGIVLLLIFLNSNVSTNENRAAGVAVAILPLVFALAAKNNVIGWLTGKGYEKLNVYHRWTGRIMFLAALFHAAAYLNYWRKTGTVHTRVTTTQSGKTGVATFTFLLFLIVQSHRFFRSFNYQLFYFFHTIGWLGFLIAVNLHVTFVRPFTWAVVAIFGFDLVLRVLRSRIRTGYLQLYADPDGKTVRIRVPTNPDIMTKWRVGQHVFIRVLTANGGLIFQSHPFTIASTPESKEIAIYARSVGRYTSRLADFASNRDPEQSGEKKCKVLLSGPYGGLSLKLDVKHCQKETVVLFAGGSGATFLLPQIDHFMRHKPAKVKRIHFIWCVRTRGYVNYFTHFTDLHKYSTKDGLYKTIYTSRDKNDEEDKGLGLGFEDPPKIVHGRVNFQQVVQSAIDQTMTGGLYMAICGPKSLITDYRKAMARLDMKQVSVKGGMETHEETFGW